MRLYLLPISTRRTLLYAQRLHDGTAAAAAKDRSYMDRTTAFAARKWAEWEKKESGWQKKIVQLGNQAFRRIPYEEWGLKSVPPLTARQRALDEQQQKQQQKGEAEGKDGSGAAAADGVPRTVELVFPGTVIAPHRAEGIARVLATERQSLHRQRLIWCFVGMPVTAPFALVPVIPNIPFFYLVYRAWSHWRALSGGRHIQWLLERQMLRPTPSPILDKLYGRDGPPVEETSDKEQMLLTEKQIRSFSETLNIPALEIEMERAIWQVEQSLEKAEAGKSTSPEPGKDTDKETDLKKHDETEEKKKG